MTAVPRSGSVISCARTLTLKGKSGWLLARKSQRPYARPRLAADRGLAPEPQKRVGGLSVSCLTFAMTELKKAIAKMKSKEATGPDEISLKLLKSLGTHMLNEHLDVYNLSFLHID